jgi:hypothetical protein
VEELPPVLCIQNSTAGYTKVRTEITFEKTPTWTTIAYTSYMYPWKVTDIMAGKVVY